MVGGYAPPSARRCVALVGDLANQIPAHHSATQKEEDEAGSRGLAKRPPQSPQPVLHVIERSLPRLAVGSMDHLRISFR
jgi:hypothetical protein